MDNFYEIFNINYLASIEEINKAYKNKLLKYKNKVINEDIIYEIKKLKTGYYILSNEELRKKYNKLLIKNNNQKIPDNDNENTFMDYNDTNLDLMDFNTVFSSEKSKTTLEKQNFSNESSNIKKSKNSSDNIISDRIFSLSKLHNRPDIPTEIIKPLQCRINNE